MSCAASLALRAASEPQLGPDATSWMTLLWAWLVISLVGRLLLSSLHAGLPGEHHWAGLPITWATSFALGSLALEAEARLFDRSIWSLDSSPWVWAPWIGLLVLRLASLPGAMVPRHRPQLARASTRDRLLLLLGLLALGLGSLDAPASLAPRLASALLVLHAMRDARLAPLAWCAVPAAAALLWFLVPQAAPALALVLAASSAWAWWRVAERRACQLACLALASLWLSQPWLAGAGLLGLWLGSRADGREYALKNIIAFSALFGLILLF